MTGTVPWGTSTRAMRREQTIIVTGAGSGIGQAVAVELARRGNRLVLCGRREEALEGTAEQIRSSGGEASPLVADVGIPEDVVRLVAEAERAFGDVHVLLNCAGRGLKAPLVEIDARDWSETVAANYTGAFLCTREVARSMIRRQVRGRIVTVSSLAGLVNLPGYSAYCSSKHAVTSLMRCARSELARHGISVITVHPYRVDTPFFERYAEAPGARHLLPVEDVARHLAALAEGARVRAAVIRGRNLVARVARMTKGALP